MSNEEIFFESPITHRYLDKRVPFASQEEFSDFIINTVLKYTGYSNIKDLSIKCRETELVYARYLCFYFLYKNAQLSLKTIGAMFGGKDHTTVIHGLNKLNKLYETEGAVRNDINNLKDIMSASVNINYLIPEPRSLTVQFSIRKKKEEKKKRGTKQIITFNSKPFQRPKAVYSNRTPFSITG